jgi:ubiquinone/menaquinone biosynthesis C-methylase UbiE
MDTKKRDFDKEAASWDENPARVKVAQEIATAIRRQVPITSDMDALDFGCGTGLLTFHLQPFVRSIIGVDSSQGMLDIFNAKVAAMGLAHTRSLLCDLDKGEGLSGRYDLIASSMTLHHVQRIAPLLAQFHRVMAPGGLLCLADLDSDEGQFHQDNTGVFHFGFDRKALRSSLVEAGFFDIADTTAAEIEKPASDGTTRRFSVFLMTGRKR